MTFCHLEEAKRAEATEAERYGQAVEAFKRKGSPEQSRALEVAEQKWKDYRDAECQVAASLHAGGSLANMVEADCRTRLANARTATLKLVYVDWGSK
jgi:uncharacterized protein YecT (DUF1311 family)